MLVFVCDDSESDRERLIHHIRRFQKENGVDFEISAFNSACEMLADFKNGARPQIIFLDIFMEGTDGMEAANELISLGMENGIVFTTSSEKHAVEAFRIGADGYLHKPYTHEDFVRAMKRFHTLIENSAKFITISSKRQKIKIYFSDLLFVESLNHCTIFHTLSGEFKVSDPLNSYTPFFFDTAGAPQNCPFCFCGRSYIINLPVVKNYDAADRKIIFSDGSEISVPFRLRSEMKEKIEQYRYSGKI